MDLCLADLGWIAPWADILVPLASAALGASVGALGARHLRREELYVTAAERVDNHLNKATEKLNVIDRAQPFDADAITEAQSENRARWHAQRLESDEARPTVSLGFSKKGKAGGS